MYTWSYLSASAAVATLPVELVRVTLAAGVDAATAIVYNHASGATNPIVKLAAAAGATATADVEVLCNLGIYVALTGTAPACCTVYR